MEVLFGLISADADPHDYADAIWDGWRQHTVLPDGRTLVVRAPEGVEVDDAALRQGLAWLEGKERYKEVAEVLRVVLRAGVDHLND